MRFRHVALNAGMLMAACGAQAGQDLLVDWRAAAAHDPAYAAARAGRAAGVSKADQAKALWRPTVMAAANLGWASQTTSTQGAGFDAPGFGESSDVAFKTHVDGGRAQGWSLMLQQPLINADRSASSKQLDLQAQLADVAWHQAQQELILKVSQVHFDVLAARVGLKAAQSEQAASQRALGEAKERFQTGGVPVTAVHDAQARRDMVAAQVLAAQDALAMSDDAYVDMTGLPAEQAVDLPESSYLGPALAPLDEWLGRAQTDNPHVLQARLAADLARADVTRHGAVAGATLDLVARASEDRIQGSGPYANGSDGAKGNSGVRWLGVQLNVPLFTGGMRSSKERESLALADQAQSRSEAVRLEVGRQTRSAWLAVSTGVARLRALEQARLSAGKRLDASRTGFEVGDRTVLDMLDAERELHTVDVTLQQARHAVLLGRLRLAAAAGGLDEAVLRDVNQSFAERSLP
ncbi:TolC family outer membrane protein [Aquabacterium sp.]|uniref:TolC family outer membrane protein n=1 Tax=Aquabacterium sp. TaxID=1872578 RepID=UPI002486FC85|nr:TolC family outer membrane protein [Aquabacterium sp.]MDI1261519.1 TolC family outer membrane protein [Aquabacterium sp.]